MTHHKAHVRREGHGGVLCGARNPSIIVPRSFDWEDPRICGSCYRIGLRAAIREAAAHFAARKELTRDLKPLVEAKCVGCGGRRHIAAGTTEHPMCEVCFMPMIPVSASLMPKRRAK
jgi:hypothetical protein